MQTKITNGEATYWIGLTDTQLKTMRFAIGSLLLAKESELTMQTAMVRSISHDLDPALMWETIETFERGLEQLAKP